MKNKKIALILTLAIISISLSCQALRPTYPGYAGGYAFARKQPTQQTMKVSTHKSVQQQIKALQADIKRLTGKNVSLKAGKQTQKVIEQIRKNSNAIKKKRDKINQLRRQQSKKPSRQPKPRPHTRN